MFRTGRWGQSKNEPISRLTGKEWEKEMGKLGKTPGEKKTAQQIDLPRLFRLLLSEEEEFKSNNCLFSDMYTFSKGASFIKEARYIKLTL